MIINHRFKKELDELESGHLKGHYHALVIGTFNPESKEGVKKNDAPWFYGRNRNKFWHLFPLALTGKSLHPDHNSEIKKEVREKDWNKWANDNRILFIDMIKSMDAPKLTNFQDNAYSKAKLTPFDLDKAFRNVTFDAVCFTRVTWDSPKNLRLLKQDFDVYWSTRSVRIINLFTPAGYYGEGNSLEVKEEWYKRDLAALKSRLSPNQK